MTPALCCSPPSPFIFFSHLPLLSFPPLFFSLTSSLFLPSPCLSPSFMSPFLCGEPLVVMLKLQQHAVQSARCIKAQYRESGKQTLFQTSPGALDLPAMPVSSLQTSTGMEGGKYTSFSDVKCCIHSSES